MLEQSFFQEVEAYLTQKMPSYLELLRQMVEINSFTANAKGVDTLGEVTAAAFAPWGFMPEYIPAENPNYGHHLVLTRNGRSGRTIALVSHLDTVFPPEEEAANDFAWRPEGNKIYGPGTVDIKGGTIAIYMLLDALQTFAPDLFHDITWLLMFNAAEEVIAPDFGQMAQVRLSEADVAACLVFEGGVRHENTFKLVVARKGMAVGQVSVEGKASHAGVSHEKGANAIVQLADTIQQLAAITDYEQNITLNVGTVSGGTVTNRVPHEAQARFEMRAFTPETFDLAMEKIMAVNGRASTSTANGDYHCQVHIDILSTTEPWPMNDNSNRLLAVFQEAGEVLGFKVLPEARGGLSDGNHVWHMVPTLDGLGPSGGNSHCSERSADGSKDQEFVDVTSFVPKTLLNMAGIMKLMTDK